MINVNMTDKAGVTLATAGKYCADNVKVTPSADILRKDEQAKTATPTTSSQDITPDAGKALSKVTVNPITAAIVGNLDASSFAASIVAAIEGKGVTVPSGAKLDALAALIESIQAGGDGSNIIVGSFILTEDLTTGSPLYIDVNFPKDEFPLMYCVFEDTSGLRYNDVSHTLPRARYVIAARTYSWQDTEYYPASGYNVAGIYTMKYIGGLVTHTNNGYSVSGGVYGSMDISLESNQIRFKATENGAPYLVGRTYRYILYWGD